MLVLAPILAQVATLGVADRTETRYTQEAGLRYGSVITRPNGTLTLAWRHLNLNFGYGPSIMVQPIEEAPRQLYLFHSGFATGVYSWGRNQLIVSEAGGYGDQNFTTLALNGPLSTGTVGTQTPSTGAPSPGGASPPPTNAPSTPGTSGATGTPSNSGSAGPSFGTNPRPAANLKIRFFTFSSNVALQRRVTNATTLIGEFGYATAGATQDSDQQLFPVVRGTRTQGTVRYQADRTNDLSLTLGAQYATSSIGASIWLSNATGTWAHRFDPRTQAALTAGVSGSRTPLAYDFVAYTIYPVFTASIAHSSLLARGTLNLSLSASTAPVIDPTTAVADPRIGLGATLGWARDRFSATLAANTSISTASAGSTGSLTSAGGSAAIMYAFSKGFSADTGVRMAYQSYQGQTVLPVSYVVFVGVSFGQQSRL